MIMLNNLRKKIDKIDRKIAKHLIKRYRIVSEISVYKQKNNIQIHNENREKEHLSDISKISTNNQKLRKYLTNIFKNIFKESRDIQ